MNQIASKGQLRASYLRWALVLVPAIMLLGFVSGQIANSGYGNRWFAALAKPAIMPPGWVFPVAWSLLYALMGFALAMILHARGARGRGLALFFFLAQLACNLAWSPLFFAAHKVDAALYLIIAMFVLGAIATVLFARIRTGAALLMLPYLAWLCFAATLNYQIGRLNPGAATLVAPALSTKI